MKDAKKVVKTSRGLSLRHHLQSIVYLSLFIRLLETYFFKCCQMLKDGEKFQESAYCSTTNRFFLIWPFFFDKKAIPTFQKGKQNGELRTEFRKGHNKYRRCCGPLCWTFMIFKTLIGKFLDNIPNLWIVTQQPISIW